MIDKVNIPQFISLKNKFYITEVTENKNITLTLNDKDLRKTIKSQILIGYKINETKYDWFYEHSNYKSSQGK